jgi:LytR cell envelope-related transcriptional attenuator
MTEPDPRVGGTHRRTDTSGRLKVLLASLVVVALAAVAVIAVLKWRGESHRLPQPAASSASSSTASPPASPTPTDSGSPSASGSVASTAPTSATPSPSVTAAPSTSAAPVVSPTPAPTTNAPIVRPPLDVLNNSHISGLAAAARRSFIARGWTVAKTGNYATTVLTTTVYFPAGEQPAAQLLAAQFPRIRRVLPAPRGVSTTHLTVVLARDWA